MSDIEEADDVGTGETMLVDLRSTRRKLAGRLEIGSLRLHWRHHGEETVFDLVAMVRLHGFDVRVEPLPAAGADAPAASESGSDNETESH